MVRHPESALFSIVFLLMMGLAGPSASEAAEPHQPVGAVATYEGRLIDLGTSWEGARICSVFAQDDVRCYATSEEASVAEGWDASESTDMLVPQDCPAGWFCLWSGVNFQGDRMLKFRDRMCQSLAPWEFSNRARSYWNRTQFKVGIYDSTNCSNRIRLIPSDGRDDNIVPTTSSIHIF